MEWHIRNSPYFFRLVFLFYYFFFVFALLWLKLFPLITTRHLTLAQKHQNILSVPIFSKIFLVYYCSRYYCLSNNLYQHLALNLELDAAHQGDLWSLRSLTGIQATVSWKRNCGRLYNSCVCFLDLIRALKFRTTGAPWTFLSIWSLHSFSGWWFQQSQMSFMVAQDFRKRQVEVQLSFMALLKSM